MAKSNNAMTGGGTSHRSHFTPSDLIVLELIVRSHELRARSVDAIAAHPAGEMCAKELAEMFDVDLSGLCYHLKEMRKGGVLEITREEKRRGAVATFYRVVPRYLDRLPDGAALDSLARCLLKEPVDVAAAQVRGGAPCRRREDNRRCRRRVLDPARVHEHGETAAEEARGGPAHRGRPRQRGTAEAASDGPTATVITGLHLRGLGRR